MRKKVGIIGAGLTGLLLAKHLQDHGFEFKIFEARDRLGGRILTLENEEKRVEMGATWFGMQHVNLRAMLDELGLASFNQFQDGKGVFEASSMSPIRVFDIPSEEQSSYRLNGGSAALIRHLASQLPGECLLTNTVVKQLTLENGHLVVHTDANDPSQFDLVVSTLPPNLFLNSIQTTPALSEEMAALADQTHTWMGTSIKFAVTYERPFWREQGFAGVCFSNSSIASEIHDHTDEGAKRYSLKGFLVPGAVKLAAVQREQMVRDQLHRYFGDEGASYLHYDELLWANESYTMGGMSNDLVPHLNNGNPAFAQPQMHGKLLLSGSETSPVYGGYMEGAVYAAKLALEWALGQPN